MNTEEPKYPSFSAPVDTPPGKNAKPERRPPIKVVWQWLWRRSYLDLMVIGAMIATTAVLEDALRSRYFEGLIGAWVVLTLGSWWSMVRSWLWRPDRRWALVSSSLFSTLSYWVYDAFSHSAPALVWMFAPLLLGIYLYLKWKNEAKETE